jgi:hypothetical protein
MKKALYVLLTIGLVAGVAACGVWDNVTDPDDDYVKLKGEPGAACTVDSECRSDFCGYPGICK